MIRVFIMAISITISVLANAHSDKYRFENRIEAKVANDALKSFNESVEELNSKYAANLDRSNNTYKTQFEQHKNSLLEALENERKKATTTDKLDAALMLRDEKNRFQQLPTEPPIIDSRGRNKKMQAELAGLRRNSRAKIFADIPKNAIRHKGHFYSVVDTPQARTVATLDQ